MFLERKEMGRKEQWQDGSRKKDRGGIDKGHFRVFQNYTEIHSLGQDVG